MPRRFADLKTRLACIFASAMLPALLFSADTPDFSVELFSPKLNKVNGERQMLVICWNPRRPEHPSPPRDAVEKLLFNPRGSVDDWFRENSGGRFRIKKAAVLGWYVSDKPGNHYWTNNGEKDPRDSDGDGFLNGHVEKWAEAIRKAAKEFQFSKYDADKNGVLSAHELGVMIVIPQKSPFGVNRPPAGREFPKREPLVVDGVRIPMIAEVYTGSPVNMGAMAHELSHLFLGTPDLYMTGKWSFAPCDYCLMDHSYTSAHLNPFLKLKLGWLNYQVYTNTAQIVLKSIEKHNTAAILFDPKRGHGEYFILENRWRAYTYDAGLGATGRGIPADGIAVWHILEDPKLYRSVHPPTGAPHEWGRRGIRLIRANGGEPIDDRAALFNKSGTIVNDRSTPAKLTWLDGTPCNLGFEILSGPGEEMRLRITRE